MQANPLVEPHKNYKEKGDGNMNFRELDEKIALMQAMNQKAKAGVEKAILDKNHEELKKNMKVLKANKLASSEFMKACLGEFLKKIVEENAELELEKSEHHYEIWYEDKLILKFHSNDYRAERPKLSPLLDTLEDMESELKIRKEKLDKLNKEVEFYQALNDTPEMLKDVSFRKEHGMISEDSSLFAKLKDLYESRYVYRQLKKGETGFVEHGLHDLKRQQGYASREFTDLEDRINRADEIEAERIRTKEMADTLCLRYNIVSEQYLSLKRRGDKF